MVVIVFPRPGSARTVQGPSRVWRFRPRPPHAYRLSPPMSHQDLSQLSLEDLYRLEVETHTATLAQGLQTLGRDAAASDDLERCMLAAHSLKGAARIADVGGAVAALSAA